jgi:hypothetical protein
VPVVVPVSVPVVAPVLSVSVAVTGSVSVAEGSVVVVVGSVVVGAGVEVLVSVSLLPEFDIIVVIEADVVDGGGPDVVPSDVVPAPLPDSAPLTARSSLAHAASARARQDDRASE